MRPVAFAVWCLLVALSAPPAAAAQQQSLADVARKEEARRKKVKAPGKVYTNKDVKAANGLPSSPAAETAAPAPGGAQATAPAAPAGQQAEAPADESEQRADDEQRWRQRMTDARGALERSRMFAEALQSRINALTRDFYARDDPAQRGVVEADRQKAIAELGRVESEIQQQIKAIADLEEEARRAGVPPGWLR
jgi:hypothetical protein